MNDAACTLQPLATSPTCHVHACVGCGAVHLTIGPMTWRFQPERFAEVARAIGEGAMRYRAMSFPETGAQGSFGLTTVNRRQ
jgi:hypothetical protein